MRQLLLPFTPIIVLVFSGCIDWYAFLGLRLLTSKIRSLRVRRFIHVIYWICCIGIVAEVLVALYLVRSHGEERLFFSGLSFSFYLGFSCVKIMFILALLVNDIYCLGYFCFSRRWQPRSLAATWVGASAAALMLLLCIFGNTYGKYYYKVHSQTIYFDDLPPAFDGFKIVQISDIHAGSYWRAKPVQRGVDLINAQHADLLVFTGDLVNRRTNEFEPWIKYFKQNTAPYGQFSITGNHDYGDYAQWPNKEAKEENFSLLKEYHRMAGYRLLLNEHVSIEKDGQSIILAGVENWGHSFGEKGDLRKALEGVDTAAFKILLTHDPSHWDAQVKNNPANIQLSLSGHTHGMQMGIEISDNIKWSPAQYIYPNWSGLAEENGRYLYVNVGFGFLGFPGRIGMRPEITVIVLKSSALYPSSQNGE